MLPKISVIIPVYNSEKYLVDCLNSVLNQTLREIEIICVNDGSTDRSTEILDHFKKNDPRLIIFDQKNNGAGEARNQGIKIASGEYLAFLDSDDFFELSALEELYGLCSPENADIGICNAFRFDQRNGQIIESNYLQKKFCPPMNPFNYRDIPKYIFNIVTPAVWLKLFRRSFISENEISFQNLKNGNDIYFSDMAVVKANRICVLRKPLVYYRVGRNDSIQATKHESPFDFYTALLSLKNELTNCCIYDEVEQSFINMALSTCLYNLNSQRTLQSFEIVYNKLINDCFTELGINNRNKNYFHYSDHYEKYEKIVESPIDVYLFEKLLTLQEKDEELTVKLNKANKTIEKIKKDLYKSNEKIKKDSNKLIEKIKKDADRSIEKNKKDADRSIEKVKKENDQCIASIQNSLSYKIGRIITFLPRRIRDIFLSFSKRK